MHPYTPVLVLAMHNRSDYCRRDSMIPKLAKEKGWILQVARIVARLLRNPSIKDRFRACVILT